MCLFKTYGKWLVQASKHTHVCAQRIEARTVFEWGYSCWLLSQYSINFSGNKLTADDLSLVMEEILDVSRQWYSLGLQLKVKIEPLDRITVQFPDPKRQLLEMLKTWLTTSDNTSWRTLTDALRSRSVGASQLASTLETKYCLVEGTEVDNETSTSDSQPVTIVTPPPSLVPEQVVPSPQADMQKCKSDACVQQNCEWRKLLILDVTKLCIFHLSSSPFTCHWCPHFTRYAYHSTSWYCYNISSSNGWFAYAYHSTSWYCYNTSSSNGWFAL